MKITVTFDSLDEFEAFKGTTAAAPQSVQKPAEEPEAPKAKKSAPKEGMPWKEAPAEAETPKKAAAPAVTEDFRVEVRKALAQLNKSTGGNIAKELIKEFGCSKLTEVKLEDLPALMEKVKARNAE
nr:MAG TPA: hypothetical protein [Caudoviricetes sp.]